MQAILGHHSLEGQGPDVMAVVPQQVSVDHGREIKTREMYK